MKPVDKDMDAYKRTSDWVARNFKAILFFALGVAGLSVLFMFISNARCGKAIEMQANAINNLSKRVVFVRADGKVAILEAQELSQSFLQQALRDLVINYIVMSGYDMEEAKEFADLEKNRKVKYVLNYLSRPIPEGYRAYVELIFRAYKGDNLPEIIWVGDLSQARESIVYQDGRFKYQIEFKANTMYVKYQRWNKGTGDVVVYMEGDVDISRSTPENPLGIKINKLEVRRYVGKGD